jgi:hypothetical protein
MPDIPQEIVMAVARVLGIGIPNGPRGDYRGHVVKLQLTDREYAVLAAESVRQQKPMALLMREAFFASIDEASGVQRLAEEGEQ